MCMWFLSMTFVLGQLCPVKGPGYDCLPPAEGEGDDGSQGEDEETLETDAVVSTIITTCVHKTATCQLLHTHCCQYTWG